MFVTESPALQQCDRTYVRFGGRKLVYFAGCDYFRLASDPRVISALLQGAKRYGLNVAASRMTTGNHELYSRLEKSLAQFFGAPAALLVSTGYLTNLVVAQALAGRFSHALVDHHSHPSLKNAARMLDCPVLIFGHRDTEDLARQLQRCGPGARVIVLTDGMFAHDGSVAPLAEYRRILPKDALILVDDAHAAGIIGAEGRGTIEHQKISRKQVIQTVTLSKSFGTYGGAILCSPDLRREILARSPIFGGSTPLPLPLASAALKSIEIMRGLKNIRSRLLVKATLAKKQLEDAGLLSSTGIGPIIPLTAPLSKKARLRQALLSAGIYPSFIRYPGAPAQGYFRFVISSEHTRGQLQKLICVLLKELAPGRAPRG
jgi:7-keto-8-aminopelargonate synthetase-like enzyme